MLGILTLDTAFPRIRGDVGCAETFDVPGAASDGCRRQRRGRRASQRAGAAAGVRCRRHARSRRGGCIGIATTCGLLVRWQRELAAALPIPMLTSALLPLPLVASTLPAGKRVGIVTYSAADLVAGRSGLPPAATPTRRSRVSSRTATSRARFATVPRRSIDVRMQADTVAAARRLAATHRGCRRHRARMREHAALSQCGRRRGRTARLRRGAAHRLVLRRIATRLTVASLRPRRFVVKIAGLASAGASVAVSYPQENPR